MFGFGQALNLPVSNVIVVTGYGVTYTVPQGKVWQLMSSSHYSYNNNNGFAHSQSISGFPVMDDCINFYVPGYNYDTNMPFIYGHSVFPSGTNFLLDDSTCQYSVYTFVEYDIGAQNLASNAPQQTTPTLYPNPTSSLLALNSDKEYDIEVYDMLGNKLMALTGNSINMEHLSTATYIVKATDKSNNEELTYKVVKN